MKDFLEKSLFKTLLIVFALAQAEGRPGFVSGSAAPQGRALVRSPLEHTGWGGRGGGTARWGQALFRERVGKRCLDNP